MRIETYFKQYLGRISRSKKVHFYDLTRDEGEVEAAVGCDVGDDVLLALFGNDDVRLEGSDFLDFRWIHL